MTFAKMPLLSSQHRRSTARALIAGGVFLLAACGEQARENDLLRPTLGDLAWSVGADTGLTGEVFGRIGSVALGNTYLAIADDRLDRVTVRRLDSTHESIELGRPGAGPGEFLAPRIVHLVGDSLVVVLDEQKRSIINFGLEPEPGFRSEQRLPLAAGEFCIVGERYYLLGYDRDAQLHEMDTAGSLLRSLALASPFAFAPGAPQSFRDRIRRNESASGQMLCGFARGMIVVARHQLSTLELVDPESFTSASIPLPNFDAGEWYRDDQGFPDTRPVRDSLISVMRQIVRLDTTTVLVQVSQQAAGEIRRLESWLFDIEELRFTRIESDLPLIAAAQGSMVLVSAEEPIPHLRAFTIRGLP